VIIAGGQGTRLGGVRKADLRLGGERQLDRVVSALGPVQHPILVASGPPGLRLNLPPACIAVPDRDSPCAGPLAGLAAAVTHLAESGITDGLLVSVAVDTAFLPTDFVSRLIGGLGAGKAVFAAWHQDFYPPNAAWRLESLQDLPDAVNGASGPASLKALQRNLGAQRVDWTVGASTNPFASINTLADLLALQRRASG